jgi:hypothetical protein
VRWEVNLDVLQVQFTFLEDWASFLTPYHARRNAELEKLRAGQTPARIRRENYLRRLTCCYRFIVLQNKSLTE